MIDFHLRQITLQGKPFIAVKHADDQYLFLIEHDSKAMETLQRRVSETFPDIEVPMFRCVSSVPLFPYHHTVGGSKSMITIQGQLEKHLESVSLADVERTYNNTKNGRSKVTPQDIIDKKPEALKTLAEYKEKLTTLTETAKHKVGDLVQVNHIEDFNRIEVVEVHKSGDAGARKYSYTVDVFYRRENYATAHRMNFGQAYLRKVRPEAIPYLYHRDEPVIFKHGDKVRKSVKASERSEREPEPDTETESESETDTDLNCVSDDD